MLGTVAKVGDDRGSGMPLDAVDHVVRLVQVIQLCRQTGQHGNQNTVDSGVGDDQRSAFVQAAGHRPRPRQDVGQRLAARVPVADAVLVAHPAGARTGIALVHLPAGQPFPPAYGDFGQLCVDLDREPDRLGHHPRRLPRPPERAAQQPPDATAAHRLGGCPCLRPAEGGQRRIEAALVAALGISLGLPVPGAVPELPGIAVTAETIWLCLDELQRDENAAAEAVVVNHYTIAV